MVQAGDVSTFIEEDEGGNEMIEWNKYDPENPPNIKNYLVYNGGEVVLARYDFMGHLSEKKVFHRIEDSRLNGIVVGVKYYAEINLPE